MSGMQNLVTRPLWPGLMSEDAEGAYLVGGCCAACGWLALGQRDLCPKCWAEGTMRATPIGRRGTLYTYTIVHQAPRGYDAPFAAGYVDLAEGDGLRLFAHLDNTSETLCVGAALELAAAPLAKAEDGTVLIGPRYRIRIAGRERRR